MRQYIRLFMGSVVQSGVGEIKEKQIGRKRESILVVALVRLGITDMAGAPDSFVFC